MKIQTMICHKKEVTGKLLGSFAHMIDLTKNTF